MKILGIGATGFIGPFVIQQLQRQGHSVTVFHRGKTSAPPGVKKIVGDRNLLPEFREAFAKEHFDLAIDFILSSERQARSLVATLRGITRRVIVLSSMDAYRAWGVYCRAEPGGPEPLPITEDSPLRTVPAYPPEVLKKLKQMVSWADEEYDKVPAERVVLSAPDLPATVLRLPMIYGPGDYVHRFHLFLKRMDDGRSSIPFAANVAPVRTPRGYVEDVAAGIVLAANSPGASGRVYNICERDAFSELEWAKKIAAAVDWRGEFILVPPEKAPVYLQAPYNTDQHLVVTSDRIRRELGYREITPESEAFARTIRWERENLPKVNIPFDYKAEDAAVAGMKATA